MSACRDSGVMMPSLSPPARAPRNFSTLGCAWRAEIDDIACAHASIAGWDGAILRDPAEEKRRGYARPAACHRSDGFRE
jgi:hypothetical protein